MRHAWVRMGLMWMLVGVRRLAMWRYHEAHQTHCAGRWSVVVVVVVTVVVVVVVVVVVPVVKAVLVFAFVLLFVGVVVSVVVLVMVALVVVAVVVVGVVGVSWHVTGRVVVVCVDRVNVQR